MLNRFTNRHFNLMVKLRPYKLGVLCRGAFGDAFRSLLSPLGMGKQYYAASESSRTSGACGYTFNICNRLELFQARQLHTLFAHLQYYNI